MIFFAICLHGNCQDFTAHLSITKYMNLCAGQTVTGWCMFFIACIHWMNCYYWESWKCSLYWVSSIILYLSCIFFPKHIKYPWGWKNWMLQSHLIDLDNLDHTLSDRCSLIWFCWWNWCCLICCGFMSLLVSDWCRQHFLSQGPRCLNST